MNSRAFSHRLAALTFALIASAAGTISAQDAPDSKKTTTTQATPSPAPGDFQFECSHHDLAIQVFGHRPLGYDGGPLLVLFHGASRDARGYRDGARKLADKLGMLLVVPEFDRARFDVAAYQEGGILKDGKVQPPSEWTFAYLQPLLDEVARRGRMAASFPRAGHSAGAQFLIRLAAFHPNEARRMILVNPGSLVFPTGDQPYPYGFGGLPETIASDAAIRRFVQAPVTFYLGTGDVTKKRLSSGKEAMKQGATRIERGQNGYQSGKALAQNEQWDFGWKLVEAEGLEHASGPMWDHPKCMQAMVGETTGHDSGE